jgi:hypothetical protein
MFKPFNPEKHSRHPFYKDRYGDAPDTMAIMSNLCSSCGYPLGKHSGITAVNCPTTAEVVFNTGLHQQPIHPYPFKK